MAYYWKVKMMILRCNNTKANINTYYLIITVREISCSNIKQDHLGAMSG